MEFFDKLCGFVIPTMTLFNTAPGDFSALHIRRSAPYWLWDQHRKAIWVKTVKWSFSIQFVGMKPGNCNLFVIQIGKNGSLLQKIQITIEQLIEGIFDEPKFKE